MTRTWRYCALTLLAGATLLACSTTQDQSTPTSAPRNPRSKTGCWTSPLN